jgi:hypothetical protein
MALPLQVFGPKLYMRFSPLPYVLHVPPISSWSSSLCRLLQPPATSFNIPALINPQIYVPEFTRPCYWEEMFSFNTQQLVAFRRNPSLTNSNINQLHFKCNKEPGMKGGLRSQVSVLNFLESSASFRYIFVTRERTVGYTEAYWPLKELHGTESFFSWSRSSLPFMESEASLQRSQETTTSPHSEPDESNLGTHNTNLFRSKIIYISEQNSGNVCYHSVQNVLPSSLTSKNLKIKIYKTVIFPVVLYGCETWSLTLGEELTRRWLLELWGPFEKFVDSHYSESELCGCAVTASPLASDALLTTLHPLLENLLQTVYRKLQGDSGTGGFDLSRSLKRFHRLKTVARLIASSPQAWCVSCRISEFNFATLMLH